MPKKHLQSVPLWALSLCCMQVGRKCLLLCGAAGMCVATLSAGVLVGAALRGDGGPAMQSPAQLAAGYLVVILVLFYVFNFAYSWGWVGKHTHVPEPLARTRHLQNVFSPLLE